MFAWHLASATSNKVLFLARELLMRRGCRDAISII